jgi:hypothetical protein
MTNAGVLTETVNSRGGPQSRGLEISESDHP